MSASTYCLLIVEDDDAFRERLAVSLRRRGYAVTTAATRAEAILHAAQTSFYGAIIDLRLGDENGLAVVRHLRLNSPETRIVVLTGYGSIATAIDAIRLGATDYLAKPADATQIEEALLRSRQSTAPVETPGGPVNVPSLERVEWEHLQRVLHECGGNISKTARLLGMERRSLQRRLQKFPPPQ